MLKHNLGQLDRIFRFLLAFWWLGPWAPEYSLDWVNWLIFIVAWIALLESFISYCWLHQICGINNRDQ